MPIKPPNSTNARSTLLGASHIDHTHAHSDTTGKTSDDHHNEDHTVVSHSDTTATGAELETLTDGSTTSLHTHSGLLTTEQIQDIIGAMVSGNTETLIAVTYDDPNGKLDFVVAESSIDHDALANFVAGEHLLEAAIDHDALTNFSAAEHLLVGAIDHDQLLNFVAAEHLLVGAIDHDQLLNFASNEHFTEVSISHDNIADVSADDHHAAAHTVASHSDTTGTGAELEELTDGSLTTLHSHSGTTDAEAIHDNVDSEISAITAKTAPVDADFLVIEDSEASNAKKSLTIGNLPMFGLIDITYYTVSNTWTKADYPGATAMIVSVLGAGGGGGAASGNGSGVGEGGGGAGGGYARKIYDAAGIAALGATEAITIGAAGAAGQGVGSGTAATAGGDSTFAGLTGTGGDPGALDTARSGGTTQMGGGDPGTGSGGDLHVEGGHGFSGTTRASAMGFHNQGGSGAGPNGGGTVLATHSFSTSGVRGNDWGGGGSGGRTNTSSGRNGGNGRVGVILIEMWGMI